MQSLENQTHRADLLLNVREVAALLNISVPSIFRHVSNGDLPRPVKLGASSRWPQSEILAVIEAAKAARATDAA